MLTVFGGLPGVGKSALARRVAELRQAAYLRVDVIESALITSGLVPAQAVMGTAGYEVAQELARSNLDARIDVVVDAVNPVAAARDGWQRVSEATATPLLFVEVICSDRSEHRRRAEQRTSDLPGISVPTWGQVEAREYEPWQGPRLVVDNLTDIAVGVDVVIRAIEESTHG